MKIGAKIAIVLLAVVILIMPAVACGEQAAPSEPTPPPAKKITLADAPAILDMSSELPSRFEHLDAASEGWSHEDLGLSKYASEVELFASGEPYQIIYCYLAIYEKRTTQMDVDALMKDEQQMKSICVENIKALAIKEGLEVTIPQIEISHPDIGDLAVSVEGLITSYGTDYSFDTLYFKSNKVYVFIYSLFIGAEKLSLIPIGREIEQRIAKFSQ